MVVTVVVIVSVGRVLVDVSVAKVVLSIRSARFRSENQEYLDGTDVINEVETVVIEILVDTVVSMVEAGAVIVAITFGSGNLEEQND